MYPTIKGKGCEISVVEASQSSQTGQKLITFVCTYWRAVHAEMLTHRDFSRNASSTRAIPTAKLIEKIRMDPAGPVFWGKNQAGMQAVEECDALVQHPRTGEMLTRTEAWSLAAHDAADWAEAFTNAGYHKQIAGRITEPFGWITVVITATSWDNFYELRAHADAQPEIQDVAYTMLKIVDDVPVRLIDDTTLSDAGSWHLPFVSLAERRQFAVPLLLAMSAARSARTSYLTHDKKNPTMEQDDALYRRLVESKPLHASPLEHSAKAMHNTERYRNFSGFKQHRQYLEEAGSIEAFRAMFQ